MILQTLPASLGWRLFKIEGQLDLTGAPTVTAAVRHAADLEGANLLIDLDEVGTADEVGVSALASAVRKLLAERKSMRVAFVAHNLTLAKMLEREQLQTPIFESGTEALDKIGLKHAA